ncbi:NUDIX hydrolase domain-like protein [Pilobolus umbonatus]|nr:NUDIX hydrolase domain-like protein [Pilobolus umbonatus]
MTEVRVGVGCFVTYKDNGITRCLIGQRKGSHGANTWQLPGGHLEWYESFEECAKREVYEETNLILPMNDIHFLSATNDIMKTENKHYVTIFMVCSIDKCQIQNVRVNEPHKLEGEWKWVTLDQLLAHPALFSPLQSFVNQRDLSFMK